MYRKILVPLDGSELAEQILPLVVSLAQTTQASVELLRVNDQEQVPGRSPAFGDGDYLEHVANKFFSSATRVAKTVGLGQAAVVIVDRASSDPSCLIAMATHGMSGIRRWLIGSVASKIVQCAANPLLLIHPTEAAEPKTSFSLGTIFVPLDGSGLAERALPHALALAKGLNSELHLMRVYSLPVDAFIVADGVMAQGPAPFRDALKNEAEVYLNGRCEELGGEGFTRVISTAIEGDPAREIIDLAARTENSMIAMSTHGRSGIGRWVLGSVAEKVLQHSCTPMLLIRAR